MTDEERVAYKEEQKKHAMATIKFIGNLFLRQILPVKVIGHVVHDLICIGETHPEEHTIDCACELLHEVGPRLMQSEHGTLLMKQFRGSLRDLSRFPGPDGN